MPNKPTQEDLDYFNCLSFDRLNDPASWISVGFSCYCLYDNETGFKIWNSLSKMSPKYDANDIITTWKKSILNKPKKMKKGSLIKFAEIDNKEESDKLKAHHKTLKHHIVNFIQEDPFIDEDENNIFIEQRYLLDKDKKLDDNTTLTNTVKNFFTPCVLGEKSESVSLNIKSPYDTGKTKLVKEILRKYKPKRVLWFQLASHTHSM